MIRATITVAAVAALTLTGCSSAGSKPTAAKPSPTPSRSSAAPSPSATTDALTALRAWADGGGTASLSTIENDLDKVDKDSHPANLPGLKKTCAQLAADIETAQAAAPIPDQQTQTQWSLALKHLETSAEDCTDGANADDQADFDAMASETSIGLAHLDSMSKRLTQLTG